MARASSHRTVTEEGQSLLAGENERDHPDSLNGTAVGSVHARALLRGFYGYSIASEASTTFVASRPGADALLPGVCCEHFDFVPTHLPRASSA